VGFLEGYDDDARLRSEMDQSNYELCDDG
jgi:hypothetical protein